MLESLQIPILYFASFVLFGCIVIFYFSNELSLLALKNLIKNRRRTIILLCVIVSGLVGLMQFFGYGEFNIYNLREGTIRSGIGHLQIYKKGYNTSVNVDKIQLNITNHPEIVDIIKNDPFLKDKIDVIGVDLSISGIIASSKTSAIFMGLGVDVATDRAMNSLDDLVEGKHLEPTTQKSERKSEESDLNEFAEMFDAYDNVDDPAAAKKTPPIWKERNRQAQIETPTVEDALIGAGLATSLQAKPGTILTLMVVTKTNTLNAVDIKVRGIIQGMSKEYNEAIVKIGLPHAWNLMARKDVSKIAILLKDTKLTQVAQERLHTIFKEKNLDLETTNWQDIAIYYMSVHILFVGIFVTIGIVIMTIVTSTIVNVMFMNVSERVREIGTLRALGQTRYGIMKLFLMEAMLVGLLGSFLSIVLGIGFAEFINQVVGGIPQPAPPGRSQGFTAFLYVTNRPLIFGIAFLLGFFSSIVASILPARKAGKMQVIECLRHV